MSRISKLFWSGALFLALMVQASLSYGGYWKFYPGEALAKEKTAFVFFSFGCHVDKLPDIPLKKMPSDVDGGEFMPGRYEFCIGYTSDRDDSGLSKYFGTGETFKTDFCAKIKADLRAGHVYLLVPDWGRMGDSFFPVIHDISTGEGQQKFSRQLESGNEFFQGRLNKVENYFERGDRNEPDWDIDGTAGLSKKDASTKNDLDRLFNKGNKKDPKDFSEKFQKKIADQNERQNRINAFNEVLSKIKKGDVLELQFDDRKTIVTVETLAVDGFEYSIVGETGKYFLHRETQVKITVLADSTGKAGSVKK